MAAGTEFDQPRLVDLYDTLNAYAPGAQPDFYAALARDLGAARAVDIGCGTGLVTARLVAAGLDVVGLDPSDLMLRIARRRPEARGARWLHGAVTALDTDGVDLAVMAGHVAQFFVTDESWDQALTSVAAALRPGGHLAFETRDPVARGWEAWTPEQTRRTVHDPREGEIETWTEVESVHGDVVTTVHRVRVGTTGEQLTARTTLRFRSVEEVVESLGAAGFVVRHRYGDWDRTPFTRADAELIVVATLAGQAGTHGAGGAQRRGRGT